MPVRTVKLDRETRRRIGSRGADDLARRLDQYGECQSCKADLGTADVAVRVLELGATAHVTAHHLRCTDSEWIATGVHEMRGDAEVTHWAVAFAMPGNTRTGTLPLVFVHPTQDTARLVRRPAGEPGPEWVVDPWSGFLERGLDPVAEPKPENPVPGWSIPVLTDAEVGIQPPLSASLFMADARPDFTASVRVLGGLIVGINTTLDHDRFADPSGFTPREVQMLCQGDDTATGWVAYSRAPKPSEPPAAEQPAGAGVDQSDEVADVLPAKHDPQMGLAGWWRRFRGRLG